MATTKDITTVDIVTTMTASDYIPVMVSGSLKKITVTNLKKVLGLA